VGQIWTHFFIVLNVKIVMNMLSKITRLIEPILQVEQIELVDIELKGPRGNQLLRIFVDTESGITINQCAKLSRDISDVLDTENLFSSRYKLEVSSPGARRPLQTEKDFLRNKQRRVRVIFTDNDEKKTFQGTIKNAANGVLEIDNQEKALSIPIHNIVKANIIFQW